MNVPVRDDFRGERIKEARRGDSRGGKGPREIGELLLLEVAQPAVGDHLRIKMRRTACGRWGTCVWKHCGVTRGETHGREEHVWGVLILPPERQAH